MNEDDKDPNEDPNEDPLREPAGTSDDDTKLTPEQLEAELAGARTALRKVNKESATRRKRIEELEAAAEIIKTTETEKDRIIAQLREQLQTAANTLRTEKIRNNVYEVAVKLQVHDPEVAFKLIDLSTIDVNENGEVEGAEDSLKLLIQKKPYLVAKAQGKPSIDSDTRNADTSKSLGDIATAKRKQYPSL